MERNDRQDPDPRDDATYEEDALGVPDLGVSDPEREPDPPDEQMPPAEHPRGVASWGTTAAEQRAGEPLDDRLAVEEPDTRPSTGPTDTLQLADDGEPDVTGELTSSGTDDDLEGAAAEEVAVHLRPEAPGGTDAPDSYVDPNLDEGARGEREPGGA